MRIIDGIDPGAAQVDLAIALIQMGHQHGTVQAQHMGLRVFDITSAVGLDFPGELFTSGQCLVGLGKERRYQAADPQAQAGQRYRQGAEEFGSFGKSAQDRAQREAVESDVGAVGGFFLGGLGMGEQVAVDPEAGQDQ